MGRKSNKNKKPTPHRTKAVGERVLCLMCNNPSALFYKHDDGHTYRLAKTFVSVKIPDINTKGYVHEDPCLKTYRETLRMMGYDS